MLTTHHYHFEPAADPAAPPLLLLHGTGGSERDLLPLARRLSPGSALLAPLGNVNERGARRFFRRLAEGVFDLPDVRARTDALAAWIDAAVDHHRLPRGQLVALGFSNGANIAATLLQRHPAALAGAILLRAMVVLDEPAPAGSLVGRRVLLLNGDADPIVPADHPPRLAAHLRAGGADVTARIHPASHNLAHADIDAARQFMTGIGHSS